MLSPLVALLVFRHEMPILRFEAVLTRDVVRELVERLPPGGMLEVVIVVVPGALERRRRTRRRRGPGSMDGGAFACRSRPHARAVAARPCEGARRWRWSPP